MSNDFYWDEEEKSSPVKTVAAPQQETLGADEFVWDDDNGVPAQPEAPQQAPQAAIPGFIDRAMRTPHEAFMQYGDVLDVAGTNVHAKAAALAAGLMPESWDTRKELIEQSANMSRYAKAKSERMGTPNQIVSGLLEAAPIAAATMATGGAGLVAAPAMTGIDVMGGAAQRQAEKYGDVGMGRVAEAGLGTAATEAALDYGMRKLPVAKPLMDLARGIGHGAAASGQASAWEDYGTGEDVNVGKALISAGAGGVIRGGMEGFKYSTLNDGGLKGAAEASTVTRNLGTENSIAAEEFAKSAGVGKNTLAGYNKQVMEAPSSERSFEEFEKMTQYVRSPEAQNAVVSDVITDMQKSMGDVLTRKNLDYNTSDGRNVSSILGFDEKQMLKSGESMFGVEAPPLVGATGQKLRGETTSSWIDSYNKKGKELINKRAGEYDTMIAKVEDQINIDTNMRQDSNVDTTQLNNLKGNLGKIREAMMNYSKGGDVRELTSAIDIYGAQAMKYASQTGMMNKLNGIRGKGEAFNPAYDLSYMKSLNDSLTAAEPNFFRRSSGESVVEGGPTITKQISGAISKVPVIGNLQSAIGGRKIRKEKEAAGDIFSNISTQMAKQPSAPIFTPEPTPAAKVDAALKDGDFDGAAKASDDALAANGMNTIKPVVDLDVTSSKIDDIVSPIKEVVPEPVVPREMLPAGEAPLARPIEEPMIPEQPAQIDMFSQPSTDLAAAPRQPVQEVPVEAPVRAVEEVIPEVAPRVQPDLEMAKKPVQKVEEPVAKPEPEAKPEPRVEEPKKVPDMAKKPKAKEVEAKVEPEPEVKAEPVKREGMPVKKPELRTVLDKFKNESTRLTNLPLKAKGREEAKMAANLKNASEFLEDQSKRLTAKGKYSDDDVAEMIDSSIMAMGGLDKIKHISDFKRDFNVDKMETDYAKKLAETAEKARVRAEKITDRIATTEKNRAARKAEREAEVTEAKKSREAEKARVAKDSHDTVKQYAKDEGLEDADLSQVLKKLGVTSSDPVNPVRARAELEKIKTARETKVAKDQAVKLKASKTEAEIKRQKADVAIKLDKLSKELDEVKTALKGATGDSRANLIRRREELDSRVREMDRVREDINGIESTEAIQKRIDSTESKIKQSERNVEDLERQLKQIEDAMTENGASKAEVTEYLSNKFDIRRLPIESIDNARNQAVKHAKNLREADKAAETADIKQAEKELVAEVKGAESEAEVQGIMDAVTKNISDMLKDPKFIAEHQAALDMMKAVGKAAKANPAVDRHKANAWEMYFDILAEGARRKSQGVKDKHLVDNIALKELREEYQKMRGISEGASTTAGRFWTDIKTVLTGDPNFKFEAESKKGALEGSGMRDRLQKAKEKSVKPKKVSIDDYI